jgi:hypothetical protein
MEIILLLIGAAACTYFGFRLGIRGANVFFRDSMDHLVQTFLHKMTWDSDEYLKELDEMTSYAEADKQTIKNAKRNAGGKGAK